MQQAATAALSMLTPASSSPTEPMQQRWVARIFERLTAQLGSKVADMYAGVPAESVQSEWAQALSGFHPSEIDRGLRACQTRPFAPTLGEFTRLCRPALDAELAYIEAGHCLRQRDKGELGNWTHPAVFRAACELSMEVRAGNFRDVRKRWEWTLARELASGWSDIPEPLTQIGHEVKTGPAPDSIKARLKELREKAAGSAFRELEKAGFTTSEIALGMTEVVR
jgi:hypothetical protein